MSSIEKDCTIPDNDWLFYNVALSKNTMVKDPQILMWDYDLPSFWKLKQVVEIMDAIEQASNEDHIQEAKRKK
jgi:hypothetical protein